MHWTRHLVDVSVFGDELQRIFKDQLNLAYLVLAVLRAGDLPGIALRFFGADWARSVRNVIHNRTVLEDRLKQPPPAGCAGRLEFAEMRKLAVDLRSQLSSSGYFTFPDILTAEPDANFCPYAQGLLRLADELEQYSRGGQDPENEAFQLWQTVDKMIEWVYALCDVDRPLLILLKRVEADFADCQCAYEQLTAFARLACELHNAATICCPSRDLEAVPAKAVRASDLHWNMDFANTFCPFVALITEAGTPAARILRVLQRQGSFSHGPVDGPFGGFPLVFRKKLEMDKGEDFMGFITRALTASLFDHVARADWMTRRLTEWARVPRSVGGADLPLGFFLLAWLRLGREADPPGDEVRARFGCLALLMAVFADQDGSERTNRQSAETCLARFCPVVSVSLPFLWGESYFWIQQREEWQSWLADNSGRWSDNTQWPAAPRIGAFAGCNAALMRLAHTAKMEHIWRMPGSRACP
jgi:hypothetical protein